jgi:hypothetical protein
MTTVVRATGAECFLSLRLSLMTDMTIIKDIIMVNRLLLLDVSLP